MGKEKDRFVKIQRKGKGRKPEKKRQREWKGGGRWWVETKWVRMERERKGKKTKGVPSTYVLKWKGKTT